MRVQTAVLALLLAAAPAELPSPASAVAAAHADALKLPEQDAPFVRYLWVPTEPKRRDDFLVALSFHCNLLSDQGKLRHPVLVAPDLVRIDTRDFGWDKRLEVWERLGKTDVYFHVRAKLVKDAVIARYWPGGVEDGKEYEAGLYDRIQKKAGDVIDVAAPWLPAKEIDGLRGLLVSEVPVVNAEWFFVQTARQISIRNKDEKVGYYEWLGLRSREDFFRLTGTDEAKAVKLFREWRAVVVKSGISQQNRQVVALGAASGRVWGTLDTFTEQGRGVARRNLRRGEFAHDAEEWYGNLANGLFVTFLGNAKGEAQATAPDQIGPDDSALRVGRDARVHANLSCIRCHGVDKDFLKPVDDWARRTFRAGGSLKLQDGNKQVLLELESQYLRDLDRLLARDRADYADAVREATASKANPKGLTAAQITKLYGEAWNRYVESPVKASDAARELGVAQEKLLAALKRHAKVRGGGDLVLSSLIDEPPQQLTRLEWEDSYGLAMSLALGLHPPEIKEKK